MSRQLCTFRVGPYLYGVGVLEVQEMISHQASTRVPLAPHELGGLINLRGQIVPAIDLRRRLGLADAPDESLPMNVIVHTASGPVSFLVDEIGDVVEIDDIDQDVVPPTVPAETRQFISSVHKFENELLHELDTASAVAGIVA